MAEISDSGGGHGKKGGKIRAKKMSTKIDMTPMVDLAFLLLTFFMLTTTFNKPVTMELIMPEKPSEKDPPPEVNEKKVLTLVLGKEDKIYWYIGITKPDVEVTDFSAAGVRKIIRQYQQTIDKLLVLIKPSDESRYKNVVDILDEMNISAVKRYALVDVDKHDLQLIKDSGK